ncbi:MAG: hypothetical protein DHS20C01_14940 [marine bacterium B5-7]|nr:MAG: hypothetical protein DHS20C01_14940 [marine bacterium B5-7]
MKPSLLQLRHYKLELLNIEPSSKFASDSEDVYPDFEHADFVASIGFGKRADEENETDFAVRLELSCSPAVGKIFPYSFSIAALGFVSLARTEGLNNDPAKLAAVNGLGLLYGAMRELMLLITGRFENGPIMLPSVNFIDAGEEVVMQYEKDKEAAELDRKIRPKKKLSRKKSRN